MDKTGSETAHEEMMCLVLGDSLQDGTVAKMANDLYCGGNIIDELFSNLQARKSVISVYHRLKQLSTSVQQLLWD